MSVSVLIISHPEIANAFLSAAKTTFGEELPLATSTVEVQPDSDPKTLISELRQVCKSLDHGSGVLILTDLFGATPSNIAQQLRDVGDIRLVTGLNLPMLLRVLNYPTLSLCELSHKAREGGQSGIIECNDDNS